MPNHFYGIIIIDGEVKTSPLPLSLKKGEGKL
jgi:hypothetical protein